MAVIVFPTQLFNKVIFDAVDIFLVEEPIYFTDFKYHKMKLIYHRSTMKYYQMYLSNKLPKSKIHYVEFHDATTNFYTKLKKYKTITIINPVEHKLCDKLKKIYGNNLIIKETINFCLTDKDIDYIKCNLFQTSYSHNKFYIYQRLKLNILLEENKPLGGKWSFDTDNRNKLPKNIKLPKMPTYIKSDIISEAIQYIEKYFNKNYGSTELIYPITHKDSITWLKKFLKERLNMFGTYQDAISSLHPFTFHSILSPMLNIGLLTDKLVIKETIKIFHKNNIELHNVEGFLRQIIGWRNYMYCIYVIEKPIVNTCKDSPAYIKLWSGTTNVHPIDNTIKQKIIPYAYFHHIERLMLIGNFLKICLLDNTLIYRLFMEWTIDAYNWVMYGNVFGMILNELKIMKKNYLASSNYILKMSNYKADDKWNIIIDYLYYNYIQKNKSILSKDYSLRYQLALWNKKPKKIQEEIIRISNQYLHMLKK